MTEVTFPGLGLSFHVDPVAISIGNFEIYWYAIMICLGSILAVLYVYKYAPKFGVDKDKLMDIVMIGYVGGIIGARAYYVIYSWDLYKNDLWSIFNFRNGGIAIYGGIIGAILIGSLATKKKRQNLFAVYDLVGLGFLIGQALGRWGNFFNQEAFGGNTSLPWGMYSEKTAAYLQSQKGMLEIYGMKVDPTMPVHPCFLYEFLWCALGFLLLHFYMKHRKFDGEIFLMYIGWYGAGRFVIEGLRTDSLMLGMLRISQVVAGLCVIAAISAILVIRGKIKAANDPQYMLPFGKQSDWEQQLADRVNAPKPEKIKKEKVKKQKKSSVAEIEVEQNGEESDEHQTH